ncbi:MAG TPA: hypothetical protein VF796_27335, partial [Humisphaera sp.]
GGTELHPPLEAILKVKPRAGVVRQVILLTDGQVTNEPAVVELCRKHRKHNRVFSFGIGAGCSAFLVKGVARATGGAAEFITAGERIDEKVLRTFARLASPAVADVALDWGGAEVQTLAEVPPVFDGDVLAVFGRCPGTLPKHATLSCKVGDRTRSWRVEVPAAAADDQGVIATMWARRTIQSLEEVNGPAQVRHRKHKLTREQESIVRLSKQFTLLSSLTTFVTVEHRSEAERNAGEPELRRVPVALAAGWGGVDADLAVPTGGMAFACAAPLPAAPPQMMPMPAAAAPTRGAAKKRGLLGGILDRAAGAVRRSGRVAAAPQLTREALHAAPPPGSAPADDELQGLVSMDRSVDKSVARYGDDDNSLPGSDEDSASAAPVRRVLVEMIRSAVQAGADALRVERASDRVTAKARIGGQYVDQDYIPIKLWGHLAGTAIRMAGMNASAEQGTAIVRVEGADLPVTIAVERTRRPNTDAFTILWDTDDGAAQPQVSEPSMMDLLALQSADGWFGQPLWLGRYVAQVGAGWVAAVESAVPAGVSSESRKSSVGTTIVLLLLATRYPSDEALWSRAARKAKLLLGKTLGMSTSEIDLWLADLRKRLVP